MGRGTVRSPHGGCAGCVLYRASRPGDESKLRSPYHPAGTRLPPSANLHKGSVWPSCIPMMPQDGGSREDGKGGAGCGGGQGEDQCCPLNEGPESQPGVVRSPPRSACGLTVKGCFPY